MITTINPSARAGEAHSVLGLVVATRIAISPCHTGGRIRRPNSLVVCAAATLIGYQSLWFAVLSKAFASREGLLPLDVGVEKFRRVSPLEGPLLVAAVAASVRLGMIVYSVVRWNDVDFGALDARSML
jgi:hypothetical protein